MFSMQTPIHKDEKQMDEKRIQAISRTEKEIHCIRELIKPKYEDLIGFKRKETLRGMLTKMEHLKEKLSNNLFEVAIVGLEKSGKSTFSNAYMGFDILPTKDGRCTYTTTSIQHGEKDCAEVFFYSSEEFNDEFFNKIRILVKKMGLTFQSNDYPVIWTSWTKTMLEKLVSKSEVNEKTNVQEDLENIIENKDSLSALIEASYWKSNGIGEEIRGYIENPAKALAVKKINIYSQKLEKNEIIYDVPGFDSPTELHKTQTKEWMEKADAIVLVVKAYEPSFNQSMTSFFRNIDKDEDSIPIGEKIFVFANKADFAETLQQNLETIKTDLMNLKIITDAKLIDERLQPGAAKARVLQKKGEDNSDILKGLEKNGIYSDGIDEIRKKLNLYNDTVRLEVMHRRIDHVHENLLTILEEIRKENRISEDDTLEKNIKEASNKFFSDARKQIKSKISAYADEINNKYTENPPITKNMKAKIDKIISPEKYQITEQELRVEKMGETVDRGDITDAEKNVRDKKYLAMYREFTEGVLELAGDEYQDIQEKFVSAFLEGLEILDSHPYRKELQEAIRRYVKEHSKNIEVNGYFDSLVRRYSGNLFLVLIDRPFASSARFNDFHKERRNFYGLALFGSKGVEEIMKTPLDEQPLCTKILYHITGQQTVDFSVKEILSQLILMTEERIHEPVAVESELYELLFKLTELEKEGAKYELQNILSSLQSPDIRTDGLPLFAVLPNPIKDELTEVIRTRLKYAPKTGNVVQATRDCYDRYFIGRPEIAIKKERPTPENIPQMASVIAEEFRTDVEILKEILSVEVVEAINIETPFLDLITRNSEAIKTSIDNADFMNFFDENENKILCEKYKELYTEKEIRDKKKEILHEIETIIDKESKGENT